MQTRALVRLGANACIIGRNVEKTESAAKDIATVRPGAKVIGIGGCDVRKVNTFSNNFSRYNLGEQEDVLTNEQADDLAAAADRCAKELGGIDFVM